MTSVKYEIVEHDGGWAYKAEGTFSETFPTHEAASRAAHRAAREQERPGEPAVIDYEDDKGRWHAEVSSGEDRPTTDVVD